MEGSTPHPSLYLDYVPGGSLEDHEQLSYNEILAILRQLLSALAHLHDRHPPIAHRDIKPANILVQYRLEGDIFVKFGDFGLSKDSSELMTICGTRLYLAPELYLKYQRYAGGEGISGYTVAVDIWSLGVVAYELMCSLPPYKDSYRDSGARWCEQVVQKFQSDYQKRPDELRQLLLNIMVVLSPESRSSAADCHDQAVRLPYAENGGFPSTRNGKDKQTTFKYTTDEHSIVGQPVGQPRSCSSDNTTTLLVHALVDSRSDASSPESSRRVQPPSARDASSQPSWRESDGHELTDFVNNYSDPFHPLYVGSSLASDLGDKESENWTSQPHSSTKESQGTIVSVPGQRHGSQSAAPNLGPGGIADFQACDEMIEAAVLLQAMGQYTGTR